MLVVGFFVGRILLPGRAQEATEAKSVQASGTVIWTCSMDPQIRRSEPGKCPICGMDLIPLDDDTGDGDPMEIKMSPTAMQLANVQTVLVGFGSSVRELRLNGKVQPDERLKFSQVTHIEGRVEQLAVNFTGEPVRKGQQLATLYSPELVTAQEELFAALKIKDMQPALLEAAKQKLKNWKLTDAQIERILASGKPQERFPILADVGGIVLEKKVNLGDYLMRGMPLYDIVDLSRVWVLFDVYESDMPWAKVGSAVEFSVQSLPGEQFKGRIAFIDPVINPMTRVATARVEVPNAAGRLKPEMFVEGVIKAQLGGKKDGLIVPKSAVLWTGKRSVVYVKNTSETGISFLMREVTLGPLSGEGYLIEEGLQAGEEIAVSGVFSIDAAAQLAGKPSMMNPEGSVAVTGHDHGASTVPAQPLEANKQAKAAVQQLFDHYFLLKDALVKDDPATAKKQAGNLKKAFENTPMSLFTGKSHDHWMRHSGAAVEALNKFLAAKNIEGVREHFKPLSNQMVALAGAFGPFDKTVYVQHCPMADDNKGADWLSREAPILNPYFGASMLTCGKVTQEIK
jgi:membrane fusion protein, copper/silver efflux system